MSRVFNPKNFPSNGSAGLGSEAKFWIVADASTRVNANPEFGFPPKDNACLIWALHFIHRLTPRENQYVV